MPDLVALDLPTGPAFVDNLVATWADGDAVAPLDPRLPRPAAAALLDALRPDRVIGPDGEATALAGGRPVEEGDALVVATSGSTGAPKGVVLTHDAVRASAMATSERLGVDPARDRWLACLPAAHVGGLSVLTRALLTGTPLDTHDRFDAGEVANAVRHGGVTLVSLVATAFGRLAALDPAAAATLRAVVLGGSAPPEDLPGNVVTTYGMTETGSGVVYDGFPLAGVEVAIGDGALGEPGEVLLRGPMLLRAYRDGTDPKRAGGWLPTGDGGRLDGDGRLHVDGRLAEVVVTGGEKVWPVAVEQVIARHRLVAEVAVWRRPDPEWGERVVAWVVPVPGEGVLGLAEVRELVAGELAPWAAPKELVLTDALPRTPNGKVLRRALA